jgi:hypothetical protein
MKTKSFDCVEMKRQAQKKLMQEYESRKDEFESYADFINSTAESDPLVVVFRKKHGNLGSVSKRKLAYSKTVTA